MSVTLSGDWNTVIASKLAPTGFVASFQDVLCTHQISVALKTTGVIELWRVRKPSVDGIITRYEGFDADGELVIPLFGVRAMAETATVLND